MSKDTIQECVIDWLVANGYRKTKEFSRGSVAYGKDGKEGFFYLGVGGSVRYGRTKSESYPANKAFREATGQSLLDVKMYKRKPSFSLME